MQWIFLLTQYFTRIPVKRDLDYSPENLRDASFLMALHAAFIALIPMGFALGLKWLGVGDLLNALLTLVVYLFLTGAFHLDGFADTLDGLFSGRSRERILEIMKDPTMGSYGTAGIFMNLALKSVIYYELIGSDLIFFLPLIAASGKVALLLAGHVGRKAKANSSANLIIGNIPALSILVNTAFTLVLAWSVNVLLPFSFSLVALFGVTLLFVRLCHARINGLVGDNLGFAAEMGEIVVGIFLVTL